MKVQTSLADIFSILPWPTLEAFLEDRPFCQAAEDGLRGPQRSTEFGFIAQDCVPGHPCLSKTVGRALGVRRAGQTRTKGQICLWQWKEGLG